ncbi:T9SS sorting signal type C domain-containing protein [Flavobacterium qiangtangense]|uniref:T9SS sorting signal type C domain-containing protein n=1 Tax=Flavobacterium qiangtangense TaxID=1442595 RepID=A0ABW1PPK9_9FLAO
MVYLNNALANPSFNFEENNLIVYTKERNLVINSSLLLIKNVKIFDVRGRFLYEAKNVNTNSLVVNDIGLARQTLILQITTEDSNITHKKVIY